jgi:hypothetical protein
VNPLDILPGWARLLLVAAVVAAAAWAFHLWKESIREDGREEVRAEWATERAAQHAAALAASQRNAAETARRLAAQKEVSDAYERDLAAARRDAAGAAVAAGRLRDQLAAFAAAHRGAAGHPAPAGSGPPAGDPIGVLADVLGRADERAGILAVHADAARAAGLACERAYDALTP